MNRHNHNTKGVVGIDFHVVDGIFQGSRTHILELFAEVIKLSPDLHFVLFLENTEFLKSFSPVYNRSNVEIVRMPHSNPVKRLCWQLPFFQHKYQLDILHTQYILPFPNLCTGIVTIHDILFETHPQYFSIFFRIRSKILIRIAAWLSYHAFTVSEYSRQSMISSYKIPSDKTSVIYNGVDRVKFTHSDTEKDIIRKKGLTSKGYLLSVGRLEPRKNHVALIRAYAQLQNPTLPLVIIGQPHFGYDQIFKLIIEFNLQNRIHILTDIQDNELPAFYRHAKLFIYPTWAEGFGMPLLEAMASGTPIITSNTTSIPEVVGDAALLVEPDDINSLTEAIDLLLKDQMLYGEMQQRGLKQSICFNWDAEARKVRDIYLKTLA